MLGKGIICKLIIVTFLSESTFRNRKIRNDSRIEQLNNKRYNKAFLFTYAIFTFNLHEIGIKLFQKEHLAISRDNSNDSQFFCVALYAKHNCYSFLFYWKHTVFQKYIFIWCLILLKHIKIFLLDCGLPCTLYVGRANYNTVLFTLNFFKRKKKENCKK